MTSRAVAVCVALISPLACQTPGVHAQETEAGTRQYAAASGFQNQKLFDAAIDEWRTFIRKFPNDPRVPRAQHYLGTCCLQEKQYADAVAAFNQVISKEPDFELADQSMLNLGIAHYGLAQGSKNKRDFAKAERAFGQMLARFPNSKYAARALYYRGECYFEQDQPTKAAAEYGKLIQKYPNHETVADATYALATTLETLKKPNEAQAVFSSFASKYPNHELITEVQMRQAELLFGAKKYREAMPVFEAVTKKTGFELADVAMLRQARCLYEQGQIAEAGRLYWNVPRKFKKTKHYDAAILAGAKCYFLQRDYRTARTGLENVAKRNRPEAAEATQWLARSYLKEGDAQRAVKIAEDGLLRFRNKDYRPELEMAWLDSLYEIKSRKKKAAGLYARFVERNPKHELAPQAQYMAALTSLEVEDHKSAKQYAAQFLTRYRSSELRPDVLFIAAESDLLEGNHEAASKQYRAFLKADPNHENAQQANVRLALAMHLADDHKGAIQWLTRVAPTLKDKSLRGEAYSILGRSQLEEKQFDRATEMLQRSVNEDPNREGNDETMLALADAYRKSGRTAEAARQMEQVLARYPNSRFLDEAQFRVAEASYEAERYEQAIKEYAAVVEKFPNGEFAPHAQYGLGWTYFNLGKYRDTVKAMTRLLDRFGKSKVAAKGHYVRAMASYELGEYGDVHRDVDAFLATRPKKNDALDAQYVKGLAYAGQKKYADAVRVYTSILRQGKDYEAGDKVAYELGWSYIELGKADDAAATFRKLAKDFPKSPLAGESLFRIGESYYDAEQFAEAAKAYGESATKTNNPEIAEKSLHKLGWSHLKAKDNDAAVKAFENQLRKHPKGELAGDARFLIGESSFRSEDWRTALAAYRQVIATRDSNYIALATFRAGECAASLQDWRASRAFHEKVLSEYPKFEMKPEARYGLGWALQNEGQLAQAVKLYEQVTEETQTETAAKARFMIGECCFAQKKHKEATRHFLKAAFTYNHKEWSPMAYFEAGRCFEVLRDTAQAKNCYEQIIKKYPKHAKARSAQSRLKALGA